MNSICQSDISELKDPLNLYIYAVQIAKGKLPEEQHNLMKSWKRDDEFVKAYFDFIDDSFWNKFKKFIRGLYERK